jgi:hypothetical protein
VALFEALIGGSGAFIGGARIASVLSALLWLIAAAAIMIDGPPHDAGLSVKPGKI